jgi:polyhydroxybutyrate depolymerase
MVRWTGVAVAAALLASACSGGSHPVIDSQRLHGSVSEFASSGCNTPAQAAVTDERDSMTVAGTTRDYLLTTPTVQNQPEPLVLDFHGYSEGDIAESLATQFSPLAQQDDFIVAFPQGTGSPVAWNTSTNPSNPDLHFVRALLDHLEATECVDTARVYATGLSQGAFMTSMLACTMSDRFAAVAPVAGVQHPSSCRAERAVPLLAFHGTADPILHFNGGIGLKVLNNAVHHARGTKGPRLPPARLNGPGYPANVAAWAKQNGCGKTPRDTKLSPHVIHRSYPCPKGTAVEFDIILGGGHSWPGSEFDKSIASVVGPTTSELDATKTIWTFFQRFHLKHLPG